MSIKIMMCINKNLPFHLTFQPSFFYLWIFWRIFYAYLSICRVRKCFSLEIKFFMVCHWRWKKRQATLEFSFSRPFFMFPQFKIIMQWRYFLWAKFSVMWFLPFFLLFLLQPPSISNTFYLNVFSMLEHAKK